MVGYLHDQMAVADRSAGGGGRNRSICVLARKLLFGFVRKLGYCTPFVDNLTENLIQGLVFHLVFHTQVPFLL